MRKQIKNIFRVVILLSVINVFSQTKESDTLKTGVIDVVKPYTPTISDAFKVKEVPSLDDKTTETKKDVKYNIFSFPVASTFTPAKGKAAGLEKTKPIKLFDNYAVLGLGNYATVLGEVYLNHAINRNQTVGGYVSHHSSQGKLDKVLLDNNFSNSKVKVNYGTKLRELSWNAEAGFQHQMYNWYGLPLNYANDPVFTKTLDVGHSFFDAHLGADISFQDTYINSGSFLFRRFGDNQGSGENRFIAKSKIDVPVSDMEISTDIKIDYLSGGFDRQYSINNKLKYGNFQIGISPSYKIKKDNLTLNIGVSTFYLNNTQGGKNKFHIYPNITANYALAKDVLIVYGGVVGDLIQNSYQEFATENPFVSPTLIVSPTDQLYQPYAGLKGRLSTNVSFNIAARYLSEKNKALFKNNIVSMDLVNEEDYKYGNSFGVVYDNVNTIGFSGQVNIDVNRNFKLSMKAEYFSYAADKELEAWNLPDLKGSVFLDYQINKKWFVGSNLLFVGERKDLLRVDAINIGTTATVVNLEGYFDANAHIGYHVNNRLSVFAKANNISNNMYQRWQNFPVQRIQFLGGATYKFDF